MRCDAPGEAGRRSMLETTAVFADAARENPAASGLVALVKTWAGLDDAAVGGERAMRAGLTAGAAELAAKAPAKVLARVAGLEATIGAAPWSLTAIQLRWLEAQALAAAGHAPKDEPVLEAAAQAAETLGWRLGAVTAWNRVAGQAFQRGDLERSLVALRRAVELAKAADAAAPLARMRPNLVRALARVGRGREALTLAQLAVREAVSIPGVTSLAVALSALAIAHRAVGEDAASDKAHEAAIETYGQASDRAGVRRELLGWSAELTDGGRLAEAIPVFERLLRALEEQPDPPIRVRALANLAVLHRRLGNGEEAVRRAQAAVEAAVALGQPLLVAEVRMHLARSLASAGRNAEALPIVQARRDERLAAGDRPAAAEALGDLAVLLGALGRNAEALTAAATALEELSTLKDARRSALARSLVGEFLRRTGDAAAAVEVCTRAAAEAEASGARSSLAIQARHALGLALRAAGRPRDALLAFREAARTERSAHAGLGDDDALRVRLGARPPCDGALLSALALAVAEPAAASEAAAYAFEACELGRSALLEDLLDDRESLVAARLPDELRMEDVVSRRAVDAARRQVLAGRAKPETLAAAWAARDEVVARVERAARRTVALVAPAPPSLVEVIAALDARTAYVAWQIALDPEGPPAPPRLVAVVVRTDGLRLVDLGDASGLAPALDAWLALASVPGTDDVAAAIGLYDRLVRPLEPSLGDAVRLVASLDGPLAGLPLEALVRGGDAPSRLVERHEVVQVPSAAAWLALRAEATRAPGDGVVAVGDPAPSKGKDGAATLPGLPESAAEAREVAALFPEDRRTLLLGAEATADRLFAALDLAEPRRALHLACHGLVDERRPRASGFVLADGGVLDADRIGRSNLPVDLAFASACEAGRGRVAHGEGLVGLPRAFLLAGVPRVIASPWVLGDRATRPFVARFYAAWIRDGLAPAAALRRAKLESLRAGGAAAHPSAWAGFVLWGVAD